MIYAEARRGMFGWWVAELADAGSLPEHCRFESCPTNQAFPTARGTRQGNHMDKKLKTKWLKALRSGKYTQGKGALRTADNKFCCLGVLVDVMDKKAWPKTTETVSTLILGIDAQVECYVAENNGTGISPETRDRIGLKGSIHSDLIEMNDSGKSFKLIADRIEEAL